MVTSHATQRRCNRPQKGRQPAHFAREVDRSKVRKAEKKREVARLIAEERLPQKEVAERIGISELSKGPPFRHLTGNSDRNVFPQFHSELIEIAPGSEGIIGPDEYADEVFDWLRRRLIEPDLEEIIAIISRELPLLHEICTNHQS